MAGICSGSLDDCVSGKVKEPPIHQPHNHHHPSTPPPPPPAAIPSQDDNINIPTNRKDKRNFVDRKTYTFIGRGKYFPTKIKDIKINKPTETVLLYWEGHSNNVWHLHGIWPLSSYFHIISFNSYDNPWPMQYRHYYPLLADEKTEAQKCIGQGHTVRKGWGDPRTKISYVSGSAMLSGDWGVWTLHGQEWACSNLSFEAWRSHTCPMSTTGHISLNGGIWILWQNRGFVVIAKLREKSIPITGQIYNDTVRSVTSPEANPLSRTLSGLTAYWLWNSIVEYL